MTNWHTYPQLTELQNAIHDCVKSCNKNIESQIWIRDTISSGEATEFEDQHGWRSKAYVHKYYGGVRFSAHTPLKTVVKEAEHVLERMSEDIIRIEQTVSEHRGWGDNCHVSSLGPLPHVVMSDEMVRDVSSDDAPETLEVVFRAFFKVLPGRPD